MKELYVGNLDYSVSENELREFFSKFGTVENAKLITDRYTGQSKGFGFVEFSSKEEAEAAIEESNGKELNGRSMKVNFSRQKEGGGNAGGGRGGDRKSRSW